MKSKKVIANILKARTKSINKKVSAKDERRPDNDYAK
jgi:hypothetical protein